MCDVTHRFLKNRFKSQKLGSLADRTQAKWCLNAQTSHLQRHPPVNQSVLSVNYLLTITWTEKNCYRDQKLTCYVASLKWTDKQLWSFDLIMEIDLIISLKTTYFNLTLKVCCTLKVCRKFYGNPSNSAWDISFWTKVVDWLTDWHCIPRAMPLAWLKI